jgi:hypothetical protein
MSTTQKRKKYIVRWDGNEPHDCWKGDANL